MPKVTIGVHMGATIAVDKGPGMSDFLKPEVLAELTFDEIPEESELKQKWDWLWHTQIEPQYKELLDQMSKHSLKK